MLTKKSFKSTLSSIITTNVLSLRNKMDQFAYKWKIGTEDAVACLLHLLLQHLDSPGTSARILFADFSSAFNTIQRHKLIQKLIHLSIPSRLIYIIYDFLANRQQTVWVGTSVTAPITTNTGAPQGCVLSPLHLIRKWLHQPLTHHNIPQKQKKRSLWLTTIINNTIIERVNFLFVFWIISNTSEWQ